jgi:flagellar basal body-associated protein FliL
MDTTQPTKDKSRAKMITLVLLIMWVIAVFTITVLKFAKVW